MVGDVIDDILVTPLGAIRNNTDTPAKIISSPGGSAANFACWLGSLGSEVNFVGRVGQADLDRHQAVLGSFGVKPFLQGDDSLGTGSIVVLVEGENRSFLTDRGANANLDVNSIPASLFGKFLYISGYALLSLNLADVQNLIARAKALGGRVACDPGSAGFIQDFGVKKFLDALRGVDILLPNLEEGRLLTGEDRPEVITAFLAERFEIVALTMGTQGCAVRRRANYFELTAQEAEVIDPTGAGDAFAAAFLRELGVSDDPEIAGRTAIRQGAIAVTISGGRPKATLRS